MISQKQMVSNPSKTLITPPNKTQIKEIKTKKSSHSLRPWWMPPPLQIQRSWGEEANRSEEGSYTLVGMAS
ncbi:hypothetical protein QJS04_geneDACA009580 [Acorus gramineus]|uniref:Uncharacterized protein n=1 Tax=Acorus gramineus TaxID=55184 RepID=A0AAV9BAP2_ACOGR|nr:hypothetical protein QJS04_geneDACA009580 [Acorus gramineus]